MNMGNAMPAKILALGILLPVLAGLSACGPDKEDRRLSQMISGDPARGKTALYNYGCGSCHTIPGVTGANGLVGPPLAGVGKRWYLAGMLPNTPDNMVAWIMHPQQINPKTVMPSMKVPEDTARDMAAYLYSTSK
ncbi:c-type cytochrome [Methylobacter sp. YRD-M1]|uniref:c-type cytochrome n=1 Tax=Methylobacter sp. YRD-M1 TaxID=2911520 RepID=UPI002279F47C|nr:c-type cytochrome [Methylobacter sp. YRD-M1]WAK03938.1 c-type cytochrome [Methylobacter sp. YRD-M1]